MVAIAKATNTVPVFNEEGLAFKAPALDLKRATALLARISDRKSTMPMLQNVAIRATATGVMFVATDLNITAIVRTPWHGSRGGFCVNAKALADIVKRLPPDECDIARKGPGSITITSGSLVSVLHGVPDRDFPKIPDDEADTLLWHTCEADALAHLLDSVAYAVCKDETRFHLNGIRYECRNVEDATCVATDGHRLALSRGKLTGAPSEGVIIPAKGATEIVKLLAEGKRKGTCEMSLKGHLLFVRYGAVTLAVKLIDAQFPPYEQVIPKDHKKLATLERKPLIAALKRAATVCTETRGVKLDFADQKLTLVSDHPDLGEQRESLPTESLWAEGGGKAVFGINAKYALDALAEIDCDRVTLTFSDELAPILFRSTEHAVSYSVSDAPHLNVTMPMRI